MEQSGRIPNKGKFRIFPCLTWVMTGACPYRDRCVFIHDARVKGEQEAYLFATPGSNNAHLSSKSPLWWPDYLPSSSSSSLSSSFSSSTASSVSASTTQYEVVGKDGGLTFFEATVKAIWEGYKHIMGNIPALGEEGGGENGGEEGCEAALNRLPIFLAISRLHQKQQLQHWQQQQQQQQQEQQQQSWKKYLTATASAGAAATAAATAETTGADDGFGSGYVMGTSLSQSSPSLSYSTSSFPSSFDAYAHIIHAAASLPAHAVVSLTHPTAPAATGAPKPSTSSVDAVVAVVMSQTRFQNQQSQLHKQQQRQHSPSLVFVSSSSDDDNNNNNSSSRNSSSSSSSSSSNGNNSYDTSVLPLLLLPSPALISPLPPSSSSSSSPSTPLHLILLLDQQLEFKHLALLPRNNFRDLFSRSQHHFCRLLACLSQSHSQPLLNRTFALSWSLISPLAIVLIEKF